MAKNPEISSDLLAKVAARASSRPYLFAYVLARYAQINNLNDDGLCSYLGCDVVTLNRLRLCCRPDFEEPFFAFDIRLVAEKLNLNPYLLAALVREVDSVDVFQSAAQFGSTVITEVTKGK